MMGLTLKQYRIKAGWSVSRMKKETGLSRDAVENAEAGRPIRAETAWRLAEALSGRLGEKISVLDIEGLNVQ